MRRQISLFGTLLRKDFRLFWQFALLNAMLIVVGQFPNITGQLAGVALLVQIGIVLATILLTLAVFHEDAAVSLKHDWLTRPVPGLIQLSAKCAFVVVAIIAPAILGSLAYNLYQGRSVGESMLTGFAAGANGGALTLYLLLIGFAALTANARQAMIIFLVGMVSLTVLTVLFARVISPGEDMGWSGSAWVVARSLQVMVGLVAASVVWLQYGYRRTIAARVVVGVAVVAGVAFVAAMTWPRIYAVQKMLSRDPAAGTSIGIDLDPGCFPARVLDADLGAAATSAATAIKPQFYPEEQRRLAGAGAIMFSTKASQKNVPAGYRLSLGRVEITYRAAGGVAQVLHPAQADPLRAQTDRLFPSVTQYWLLPRSMYARLVQSRDAATQIDYSLSLLAPKATAEFPANGKRGYYPGLGYCGATVNSADAVVSVDCMKPGAQPGQIVASLVGAPESAGSPGGLPDFTPAALDFWGAQRHAMRLRSEGRDIPRVRVVAFEARAHFDRHLAVPGVLGGSVSSCPAP
jgi:hypothetical protein